MVKLIICQSLHFGKETFQKLKWPATTESVRDYKGDEGSSAALQYDGMEA
ncbi:MAG TPA: hypothetical protein GXX58_02650, partial [Gelria sp.]|nr:hypothetical protein [Gelria sp.]